MFTNISYSNFSFRQIIWSLTFFFLFFIPRPSWHQGVYYWIALGLVGFLFIFSFFICSKKKIFFSIPFLVFIFFESFLAIALFSFSLLLNFGIVGSSGFLTRPICWLAVCLFSYISLVGSSKVDSKLIANYACKAILFIQCGIGLLQLYSNQFFDLIWCGDKTSVLRITGSLFNPNNFALVINIIFSYIYLFENRKRYRLFFSFIALFLILLSGSRTNLIIFPIITFVAFVLTKKIGLRSLGKGLFLLIIILIFLGYVLNEFSEKFYYAATMLEIFQKDGIEKIGGLTSRFSMWENAYRLIEKENWPNFLFGIGDANRPIVIDNDYVYSFCKFGLIGLSFHLFSLFLFLFIGFKNSKNIFGKWLVCITLAISIQGLTAESFNTWLYSTLVFFVVGSSIGLHQSLLNH